METLQSNQRPHDADHSIHSNKEKMQLFTILSSCATLNEFKLTVKSIIESLGFSDFTFIALGGRSGKRLTSLPEELYKAYQGSNYAEYDLVLEHTSSSTEPLFFSDVKNHLAISPFASKWQNQNRDFFALLASFEYYDCYCVPLVIQSSLGRAVFLVMDKGTPSHAFREKIGKCKPLLSLLIDAVAYFSISKFPQEVLSDGSEGDIKITAKPLRLLNVIATEGLMLKEAAQKLCISLDTANKHIAVAKKALGACTLAHAVYLAFIHGLLDIENGEEK